MTTAFQPPATRAGTQSSSAGTPGSNMAWLLQESRSPTSKDAFRRQLTEIIVAETPRQAQTEHGKKAEPPEIAPDLAYALAILAFAVRVIDLEIQGTVTDLRKMTIIMLNPQSDQAFDGLSREAQIFLGAMCKDQMSSKETVLALIDQHEAAMNPGTPEELRRRSALLRRIVNEQFHACKDLTRIEGMRNVFRLATWALLTHATRFQFALCFQGTFMASHYNTIAHDIGEAKVVAARTRQALRTRAHGTHGDFTERDGDGNDSRSVGRS